MGIGRSTICSKHDDILKQIKDGEYYIKQIRRELRGEDIDINSELDELENIFSQIYVLAIDAKHDGQNMEDRLTEYRNAIEDLGFVRKK